MAAQSVSLSFEFVHDKLTYENNFLAIISCTQTVIAAKSSSVGKKVCNYRQVYIFRRQIKHVFMGGDTNEERVRQGEGAAGER